MSGPILAVEDLTVRYGGVTALHGVTFDAAPGEVLGLIGPNGAGKTTCIDALTGFTTPTRGAVRFAGQSLEGVRPHHRARSGFVRTFQSLELFDDLTVRENLLVSASTPTWWSTVTDALWPKHEASDTVDDVLDLAGLTDTGDRLPTELSNGQRHLVAVARALVSQPQLVLLDEPAAGLDSTETAELADLLRKLPARGITVLLVDHDMSLVLGVCDRILVLDFGRLIASGTPAQVRADPAVIAAYLGTSAAAEVGNAGETADLVSTGGGTSPAGEVPISGMDTGGGR